MCGICGLVATSGPIEPSDRHSLELVASALGHRGPDGTRLLVDGQAVLGACRLVIRGPSGGAQPLRAQSGAVLVCNGEIDNHEGIRSWLVDRGHEVMGASDIDVLPALYDEMGERLFERLDGAFAIAVWDPRRSLLILARDRAGERPLFYARSPKGLAFASEIAALLRLPWVAQDLDLEALRDYLRRGHFVSPLTPFASIRKVGPGEIVVLGREHTHRQRYWRWALGQSEGLAPTVEEFGSALEAAVERQIKNDVPFGVFLSGGLDSTLLAALAARCSEQRPVGAFTIRFSEASFDEGAEARRAAKRLGIPCAEVLVRPESFPGSIDQLVQSAGEPLADPAWVPTMLLADVAARSVRVVLVGEGADEVFGGYPTYSGINVAAAISRLPEALTRRLRRVAEWIPPSDLKVPPSLLIRRLLEGIELRGLARHEFWTAAVADPLLDRLGLPIVALSSRREQERRGLLDEAQVFDFETSLAEGLLTKSDRAAMLSALEVRAPYLDRQVLELASRLPREERVAGLRTKIFLKRYAAMHLPPDTIRARKRGLSVPLGSWFRGPLRDFAEDSLRNRHLQDLGLDQEALLGLLREHLECKADHSRPIWAIATLSRWMTWAKGLQSGRLQ